MSDKRPRSPSQVISWLDIGEHLVRYYGDKNRKEQVKHRIPERWTYFGPDRYSATATSGGDQRLRALRDGLQYMDDYPDKFKRSRQQKQFHEAFIAACSRNIYKGEFAANYLRILKENSWDEARQEVLVCCPRRFGKTIAVCMFVAAYAMTQPNCQICIFSPGRRQSEMLLDQVKDFIFKFPYFKIKRLNKENLWLHGETDNDTRKISAYPSKVEIGTNGESVCRAAYRVRRSTIDQQHPFSL